MDKEQMYLENRYPGLKQVSYGGGAAPAVSGAGGESVTVKGQTYTRPANFTDQQWADYKRAVGASQ